LVSQEQRKGSVSVMGLERRSPYPIRGQRCRIGFDLRDAPSAKSKVKKGGEKEKKIGGGEEGKGREKRKKKGAKGKGDL